MFVPAALVPARWLRSPAMLAELIHDLQGVLDTTDSARDPVVAAANMLEECPTEEDADPGSVVH
ncbi:hypothetical protein LX15_002992 [Streptoalloteichus tenebrarius]|uniref:Uncharacterized protein n=1 Tax=Streptoalloteichus tenebrarius (strain ATCC 17920 / DSM 40477 / JCM 4838 / CBS 697.72 / NBRC 16177 / NCIMB 11028 / NRRL B-12390 / A12253. 1 / ISP 5477) TaxID=1933 RepID=A0ABT1HUU6_STRSD|nr:hypothetical protein [Streptoalloteichus tenebrarius]BFE99052.1 hypothetical protein GCM10020241_07280 [Streptoalloteichus tenebrarius]